MILAMDKRIRAIVAAVWKSIKQSPSRMITLKEEFEYAEQQDNQQIKNDQTPVFGHSSVSDCIYDCCVTRFERSWKDHGRPG